MHSGEFKKILKDYFSFTRQERSGMLILGFILFASMLICFLADFVDFKKPVDQAELENFLKGVAELSGEGDPVSGLLFSFDPNKVSKEELDSLGIPRNLKSNLLRYRSKGGIFRKRDDLRKLYGMNDSLFEVLRPYILLPEVSVSPDRDRQSSASPADRFSRSPADPSSRSSAGRFSRSPAAGEKFRFNPNTATEEELTRLGFTAFQRRNLLNYRSKGGTFRQRADLLKIYGMDSSFYWSIESLIETGESPYVPGRPAGSPPAGAEGAEYMQRPDMASSGGATGADTGKKLALSPSAWAGGDKAAAGPAIAHSLELNNADSASLLILPGIGPSFAGRIIRYRHLLGGYFSTRQLLEVYGMTEEKLGKFSHLVTVDTTLIRPVRINFADERTLRRHPYIPGEEARKIIGLRSAQGAYTSGRQLVESHIFDEARYQQLRPYLTCR